MACALLQEPEMKMTALKVFGKTYPYVRKSSAPLVAVTGGALVYSGNPSDTRFAPGADYLLIAW